ncbi:MAG: GAF domain-containing protein [Proteobacteria bacterium]|nr:GAF domain-containing protein [Pseudomonadota bacterium]MBU1741606.1 GAF domain-containing protein [Pseudomonadota bacterium]
MTTYEEFFHALCQVNRAFLSARDSQEILDLIVSQAVDTMDLKAACLFMTDEEQNEFVDVAQQGLSEAYLRDGLTDPLKIIPLLERDGHLFVLDATTDPRLDKHEVKKAEGIASVLAVPVNLAQKMVGMLVLFTDKQREFALEEIDFVTAMAEQGAMAIELARLLERTMKNSRIFLELAQAINSTLDIKGVLQILTSDVAEALQVKASSIRLLDEDKKELKLVAGYGLSQEYLDKGPISAEKSIAAALKGKPVVVADASQDPGVQYREEKKKEGIVSILCVPIMAKDEVIGVMRLYSDRRRHFREDEIMLASALAQQGGLAIQNASMYLMLHQDMTDLEKDIWSHRSWF